MIIKSVSFTLVRQITQFQPGTVTIEAELSTEVDKDGKQKERASDVLNSLKKFAISHLYIDKPSERDALLVQMLPKATLTTKTHTGGTDPYKDMPSVTFEENQ